MSLQVSVSLDRKVPVYLVGETVTVQVRVENLGRAQETLAWGSVQLTSDRTFGRRKTVDGVGATSIAPSASNVFSSLPSVLFCDLVVLPGQTKLFSCKVPLPVSGLPPSFKGHYIRYTNRITIGVARIRSTVRMLHVPLRVMNSVGLETRPRPPLDPFLAQIRAEPTVSEVVASTVDEMTAPRRPSLFSLTNQHGKIASLVLFKKVFRLGEDVVGHISFAGASQGVVELTARVETEESIVDDGRGIISEPHVSTVASEEIVCVSIKETSFRLPLPMMNPPTFHNDAVHFKWRLRFELVTTPMMQKMIATEDDPSQLQCPSSLPVERLAWATDIYVLPCTPANAALTDEGPIAFASISL